MSRIFSNLRTTAIPRPGRRPSGGPLASLTNLIDLQLGNTWLGQYLYNQITDVGPLTSLTNLTSLGLLRNPIKTNWLGRNAHISTLKSNGVDVSQ